MLGPLYASVNKLRYAVQSIVFITKLRKKTKNKEYREASIQVEGPPTPPHQPISFRHSSPLTVIPLEPPHDTKFDKSTQVIGNKDRRKFANMVMKAVRAHVNGSTLKDIKRYISYEYSLDPEPRDKEIKLFLANALRRGKLKRENRRYTEMINIHPLDIEDSIDSSLTRLKGMEKTTCLKNKLQERKLHRRGYPIKARKDNEVISNISANSDNSKKTKTIRVFRIRDKLETVPTSKESEGRKMYQKECLSRMKKKIKRALPQPKTPKRIRNHK